MSKPFSIKKFIKSFGYAFNGIRTAAGLGQNMRFHLVAAFAVVFLSFLLKISKQEFLIVILCITAVITTELINTAIEKLCDFVSPQHHEKIKVIKDITAAAVLITAIGAFICGLIIFLPKLLRYC